MLQLMERFGNVPHPTLCKFTFPKTLYSKTLPRAVRHSRLTPISFSFFPRAGTITQIVDNLDTTKSYRIVFYYVEFDTPNGACTLTTTMGGQQIVSIVPKAPRTPNNQFEQIISDTFQPSASSLSLSIGITCAGSSVGNRSYMDDVSIEEVTV